MMEGFTIDPNMLESNFKEQMTDEQVSGFDRVLDKGNELIFGKDTHYQLLDGIESDPDVPGTLGKGAFNLMMMLYQGGGNTMPPELILPAGTILLARTCEFLNKSGLAPVTDDDYEKAMHIFTVMLHSLDPNFNDRMSQSLGQGEQQPQPQPQGILNQEVQ